MLIRYNPGGTRGTWHFTGKNGKLMLLCPICGSPIIDYYAPKRILEDGSIPGVVICPYEGCSFQDSEMTLGNWTDRRKVNRAL